MNFNRACSLGAACIAIALAAPALADVKAGVDAWSRGDYDRAVSEWRGPAAAGDADAQFNMAQAYRLGRGVDANTKQAEIYYAKAADQGHLKAADNYGLLLFQDGRREQAMPYVKAASERGDPRAQYLLGIAHFNGDLVAKDWVRAYALLTLANSAGLPQAKPAIQQMDDFIPMAQRQQAQSLAVKIKQEADARRATQLAAADLGGTQVQTRSAPPPPKVAAATPQAAPLPSPVSRMPQPIASAPVPPSVAAAEAAVSEARRVTGTQSPSNAGADYASASERSATGWAPGPSASAAAAPRTAAVTPRASQAPAPAPAPVAARPASRAAMNGPWKVQLGAFGVAGNADKLWSRLSGRAELAGAQKVTIPSGRLTRLLAGGFASRGDAQQACNALKRGGQDCLVTK